MSFFVIRILLYFISNSQVLMCKYFPYIKYTSYINWIINAIIVVCVASIVTLGMNYIIFRKEFKEVINIFKNMFRRKRRN